MSLHPNDRRAHLNFGPLIEALTRRRFLARTALAALIPTVVRGRQAGPAIRPYLQSVTPDSIWVGWRTDSGTEATVSYGLSADSLNNTVSGMNQVLAASYNWHSVPLTGLSPSTYYYYKVKTGAEESAVHRFRTLPARGTNPGRMRFLVIGDNQIRNEPRYETIIARAKARIEAKYGVPIEEAIDVFLNVGDQVDVGTLDHYQNVHLAKVQEVSPNLAIMTLVGNHETYSDPSLALYKAHFNYAHLTYAGIVSPGGHTYYANHVANILFIHTNSEDTSTTQTAWVQQIVNAAKDDPQVEWIVSLVHRPYQAEQYVGDISGWFRTTIAPILAQTPKHVLNIGAHHHLYARGQMRDWPVYHIISGGTAWDQYWGQSVEQDQDDVQKTIANWAWQILDFDLNTRRLTVECFAEAHPKLGFVYPGKLIDTFYRQFGLPAPQRPSLLDAPAAPVTLPFALQSTPFVTTAASETFNSTQFQISANTAFTNLKIDHIRAIENFYGDTGAPNYTPVNIHAGLDLFTYTLGSNRLPNGTYFARVRHRDSNCQWSPWSAAISFTVEGSVYADPKISLPKSVFSLNEDFTVTYENGPGISTDWIGIYKKGQTPGPTPSTTWQYVTGTAGTLNFTFNLPEKQEYFAAFFTNDGYTEVAPRVPFYVGSVPVLSAGQTVYEPDQPVVISYANAPGGPNERVAIYRAGQSPATVAALQSSSVSDSAGSRSFTGLPKGFYYVTYLVSGGNFEIAARVAFSVGSVPADLSLAGGAAFAYGTPVTADFGGGSGTPKDYIGIFVRGADPGVDRLVTYQYVAGKTAGSITFADSLPAGDYFVALFINDSYTEISNRVDFTITGGPVFPQVEGIRQGTGNQFVIGVKVQPGATHKLQYSADLTAWEMVQSFKGEGLRMDLTVTRDATAGKAFWRVIR
jgi:hypothetical protein